MQKKDHPGSFDAAASDRRYTFTTEAECGLWASALHHAMTWSPHAVTSLDVTSSPAAVKSPIASTPAAHAAFTPPRNWPANSFVFYRLLTLVSAPSNSTESLTEILAVVRE